MTKAAELRELTTEELEAKLADTRAELFNLRFQFATGQFDRTHRFKELKREIARIMTLLGEQAVAEAEAAQAATSVGDDAGAAVAERHRGGRQRRLGCGAARCDG